jgi:hypothetical protein
MTITKIYQIYYSPESYAALDTGFIPLDNTNGSSSIHEYGAIREFFLNNAVGDDELIGFFSPRFYEKTGLTATDVYSHIEINAGKEVYLFNPFFHLCAWNKNIFDQGEVGHPGLIRAINDILQLLNININVNALVMSSINTVYCNYFVAKMSFWKKWLAISEFVFQLAGADESNLSSSLNNNTNYHRGPVPMQVFIIERIASFLLTASGPWNTSVKFIYKDMQYMANSDFPFLEKMHMLDALKTSFIQTNNNIYMKSFDIEKEKMIEEYSLIV